MQLSFILLLISGLLTFSACQDDNDREIVVTEAATVTPTRAGQTAHQEITLHAPRPSSIPRLIMHTRGTATPQTVVFMGRQTQRDSILSVRGVRQDITTAQFDQYHLPLQAAEAYAFAWQGVVTVLWLARSESGRTELYKGDFEVGIEEAPTQYQRIASYE